MKRGAYKPNLLYKKSRSGILTCLIVWCVEIIGSSISHPSCHDDHYFPNSGQNICFECGGFEVAAVLSQLNTVSPTTYLQVERSG